MADRSGSKRLLPPGGSRRGRHGGDLGAPGHPERPGPHALKWAAARWLQGLPLRGLPLRGLHAKSLLTESTPLELGSLQRRRPRSPGDGSGQQRRGRLWRGGLVLAGLWLLGGCLSGPEEPPGRSGPSPRSLHIQRECRRRIIDLPATTNPADTARAYGRCLRELWKQTR